MIDGLEYLGIPLTRALLRRGQRDEGDFGTAFPILRRETDERHKKMGIFCSPAGRPSISGSLTWPLFTSYNNSSLCCIVLIVGAVCIRLSSCAVVVPVTTHERNALLTFPMRLTYNRPMYSTFNRSNMTLGPLNSDLVCSPLNYPFCFDLQVPDGRQYLEP